VKGSEGEEEDVKREGGDKRKKRGWGERVMRRRGSSVTRLRGPKVKEGCDESEKKIGKER